MLKKAHSFLYLLTAPVSLAGIIFYYDYATDLSLVVYICAGVDIFYSILNCIYGGQNNMITELCTCFIGAVVALIFKIEFFPCIAVAICYSELILVISSGVILFSLTRERKK